MSKIFITGSADGLGQLTASKLIEQGHEVVLHARNEERAKVAIDRNKEATGVLIGDLSDIDETKRLAEKVNESGPFDVVIHNAGVYQASATSIFHVNTLAPYILTSLLLPPKRLIYLSSDMHTGGTPNLDSFVGNINRINYSDSKLHVLMLALAVARKWKDVYSNAVNPGWVPTKMGGKSAPDDLQQGYETQVWLATSEDDQAKVTGRYFFHKAEHRYNELADDVELQEKFLTRCAEITGISAPSATPR